MLELAIDGNHAFDLCDIELKRGGTSYSVDTVRELVKLHPDRELFFIIGSDTLPELHLWRNIEELLGLCRFITACRPGYDARAAGPDAIKLKKPWPERLLADTFAGHQVDISSSDIRYRVAEGMSIRYLVPAQVEMYILEHRLYSKF